MACISRTTALRLDAERHLSHNGGLTSREISLYGEISWSPVYTRQYCQPRAASR